MKKLISVFILCFVIFCSVCIYASESDKHYVLYKTKNIYTFLKLDTRTGQIWQIHWGTNKNTRAVYPLSTEKLSSDTKDGRFALFSTENIYNFVLLDTLDGKTWQVQLSFEEESRFIIPIVPSSNAEETQRISLDLF